jgi:hypothetical protein
LDRTPYRGFQELVLRDGALDCAPPVIFTLPLEVGVHAGARVQCGPYDIVVAVHQDAAGTYRVAVKPRVRRPTIMDFGFVVVSDPGTPHSHTSVSPMQTRVFEAEGLRSVYEVALADFLHSAAKLHVLLATLAVDADEIHVSERYAAKRFDELGSPTARYHRFQDPAPRAAVGNCDVAGGRTSTSTTAWRPAESVVMSSPSFRDRRAVPLPAVDARAIPRYEH